MAFPIRDCCASQAQRYRQKSTVYELRPCKVAFNPSTNQRKQSAAVETPLQEALGQIAKRPLQRRTCHADESQTSTESPYEAVRRAAANLGVE